MNTDQLLTDFERCGRIPWWGQEWEKSTLEAKEFLERGVYEGLTTERKAFGDAAGDKVVELIRDHEISSKTSDQYSSAMHIAAMSDLVSVAIRQPQGAPWKWAEPVSIGGGHLWRSDAFLAPSGALRRIVFVSNYTDERHYSICREWGSLGACCAWNLPMQVAVVVTGSFRDGRYNSFWTNGLRHPINKSLKFRKKNDQDTPFKDTWERIHREDYDDIDTETWWKTMASDGVAKDILFKIDIPSPTLETREYILNLAVQKLDAIAAMNIIPEQKLSCCHWPVKCPHVGHCWSGQPPSGRFGFVRIGNL